MPHLQDWTRGLPEFLRFLGLFLVLGGAVLVVMWTTAVTSGREIWALGFFAFLALILGIVCLAAAWISRFLVRRRAPSDRAV